MPDFSHLKKLEQNGDRLWPYTFHQIEGAPTIRSKPATDANKAFRTESIRRTNARAGQNRRGTRLTESTLEESRQEDREVIAFTCAAEWDVVDANGDPVEFTPQNCLEFFEALPNWLFDDYRAWITNAANFVEANTITDGGETLGNS